MNEIEELFPFYALGTLSQEERAQVEAYVETDEAAKARLEGMIAAVQMLPYSITPVPPRAEVRAALMARVQADLKGGSVPREPIVPVRTVPRWRRWLASPLVSGLALATVVVLAVWVISLQGQVRALAEENRIWQARAAALEQENNLLRDELRSQADLLAFFTSPERQDILIAGTDHQPDAWGTLVVGSHDDTQALFVASNLPPLPPGWVYQFWLMEEGAPVGAGVFHSDAHGLGILVVLSHDLPVLAYDAVGVSIEPEGGSKQPTGNIVLLGELPGG